MTPDSALNSKSNYQLWYNSDDPAMWVRAGGISDSAPRLYLGGTYYKCYDLVYMPLWSQVGIELWAHLHFQIQT